MAIRSIDYNKCIGCGICVESCPMDVLRLDSQKQKALIAYPDDCQVCHLCQHFCPQDAIEITTGHVMSPLNAFNVAVLGLDKEQK